MYHSRPKIAFVSPHCLVDFTNGAATATRDGLKLLAGQGFECMAFCGTRLDEAHEGLIQEQLFRRGVKYHVRKAKIGPYSGRLIFLVEGNVPVTLFENGSTCGGWLSAEEVKAFATACDIFLRRNRPDIVLTYGGDLASTAVQQLAKRHGAKIAFWLHNFGYPERSTFALADCVIVGSEFSKRYYREKLGLECHVLPYIVHWKEASVADRERGAASREPEAVGSAGNASMLAAPRTQLPASYVTFINPQEIKGLYVFARIARELARRRPDIPLLVTQGRSSSDALKNPALGLAPHLLGQFPVAPTTDGRNITTMPFTPDPQAFYPMVFGRTMLLLMPSLWLESFGLVAAEAMLNGIPVLASNRGALPETIGTRPHRPSLCDGARPLPEGEGTGGFLFDIPARYTPQTRDVPTAEEVEPWVETIIRLWDDAAYFDRWSRAARERAQAWNPDHLAPLYRDFFGSLVRRRGSPLMPLS